MVQTKIAEYKRDGKDPRTLLDPKSPEFLGSPEIVNQYRPTLQDSAKWLADDMARGREAKPPTGSGSSKLFDWLRNPAIDMAKGMQQQKLAVESGYWPLFRYNPALAITGRNPFQLDSHAPKIPLRDYIYTEGRYRMLIQSNPVAAKLLLGHAQETVNRRWQQYQEMANRS